MKKSISWEGRKDILVAATVLLASLATWAQQPQPVSSIDPALAAKYFQEAKAVSDRDGGALWGQKVYGAMLFVDENTRDVVANRPDLQGILAMHGDVFTGRLPDDENVANTTVRWAGVYWTMLHWPPPDDVFDRDKILIHECFHRIQEDLGLGGSDPSCDHLDTAEGRIWIQLEWRALRVALSTSGEARKRAVQDAILFRAYRRSLFPGSRDKEQTLEIHEGLPEYTGVALCAKSRAQAEAYATAVLLGARDLKTYVRSFAYATGPAYGLLLDDAGAPWRKGLTPHVDLAELLGQALSLPLPDDLKAAATARLGPYAGQELRASEEERVHKKSAELAAYRSRFVDGPVVQLPIARGFNYSFDPTSQVPLEGWGTVYPYLRVVADWGVLKAENGALLLLKEGAIQGVRVPAPKNPAARPVTGDGWTLELKPGWNLVPGSKQGDWEVRGVALPNP